MATTKHTAGIYRDGKLVMEFDTRGRALNPMTITTEDSEKLAKLMGWELASWGVERGTFLTEALGPHAFKNTCRFAVTEGRITYRLEERWKTVVHSTFVGTRTETFDWVSVDDYSANYNEDGTLRLC